MADSPPTPDTRDDTDTDSGPGVGPDRGSAPGAPRWVKVSGLIALVLVLLVVIVMVTGAGGQHGPGRHIPPAGQGQQRP